MNFLRHFAMLGNPLVDSGSKQVITVIKRIGAGWQGGACLMFGAIQNLGTAKFRFTVNQSDNNNKAVYGGDGSLVAAADAYAAVTLRVNGAGVAYVDVPPGATVEFLIEYAAAFTTGVYLEFTATPSSGVGVANGMLGLVYRDEALVEFIVAKSAVNT